MNEAQLSASLKDALKLAMPRSTTIKHNDARTPGIPDLSHHHLRLTSWLEVKYLNPRLLDDGRQRRLVAELARDAFVLYAIYLGPRVTRSATAARTALVEPACLDAWLERAGWASPSRRRHHEKDTSLMWSPVPFDHTAIASMIRTLHVNTYNLLKVSQA